jgi:fucose permease
MPGVSVAARRARWAVSAHFLVLGVILGMWMARIPAAKAQAHLSDGTLGAALFAVPIGLMLGATAAERLVDRVGSAAVARVFGVGSCVLIAAPGLANNLPELTVALLGVGFTSGMLDVAQNGQGLRVEGAYGRPVMTSMHAFYSLGAIGGSLAGGALAWAGGTLLPSLAAAGALGALIDAAAGRWLLPGAQHLPPDGSAGRGYPPGERATDRRRVRRLIIMIGVIGVCGMFGEGAAGDWSAVYLRDNLGASAGFAALGFAAFSVTMTTGRALGDRLIRRFGVVALVRGCGAVAAFGLGIALITANPVVTIAGFAILGAGLSAVVPQVFAAGGRADPARPGSGIAKVVGFSYAGQAAGPATIGVIAATIGLRLALAVPALLAVWIAVAAPALGAGRERSGEEAKHGSVPSTPYPDF